MKSMDKFLRIQRFDQKMAPSKQKVKRAIVTYLDTWLAGSLR